MGANLAEVLRRFGPANLRDHSLTTPQAHAWRAIVTCRTPALGGQLQRCVRCAHGPTFIERFVQHVLPSGFKRIRRYGLLSPALKHERMAQARAELGMQAIDPQACEDAAQFLQRTTGIETRAVRAAAWDRGAQCSCCRRCAPARHRRRWHAGDHLEHGRLRHRPSPCPLSRDYGGVARAWPGD